MNKYLPIILSLILLAVLPLSVVATDAEPELIFEDELNSVPNGSQTIFRYTIANHNNYDREYYLRLSNLPADYTYDIVTDTYTIPAESLKEGYIALIIPEGAIPDTELDFTVEVGWSDRAGEALGGAKIVTLTVIIKEDYQFELDSVPNPKTIVTTVPVDEQSEFGTYYKTVRVNELIAKNLGNVKLWVDIVDYTIDSPYDDTITFVEMPDDVTPEQITELSTEIGWDGWDIIERPGKLIPRSGTFGDFRVIPFGLTIDQPSRDYWINITFEAEGYSYRNDLFDFNPQGEFVVETTDTFTLAIHIKPIIMDDIINFDWDLFYLQGDDEVDENGAVLLSPQKESVLDFVAINKWNYPFRVLLQFYVWKGAQSGDEVGRIGEGADLISSYFNPSQYNPSTESQQFFDVKDEWMSAGLWVEDDNVKRVVQYIDLNASGQEDSQKTIHLSLMPPQWEDGGTAFQVYVVGIPVTIPPEELGITVPPPPMSKRVAGLTFDHNDRFEIDPNLISELETEDELSTTMWWLIGGFVAFTVIVAGVLYYMDTKFTNKGLKRMVNPKKRK